MVEPQSDEARSFVGWEKSGRAKDANIYWVASGLIENILEKAKWMAVMVNRERGTLVLEI